MGGRQQREIAAVEAVIERLHGLHPRLIDLSLDRLRVLLAKLGHPERRLPPVIHVAGTNGKGSTCAFIRAMAEAAGWRTHAYTSPHLVRYNERFRIAGSLVSDRVLVEALERVERINAGAAITVFEVITAAALELFAASPAELCVLEVGLGGRGDATNVIERPAACAITSISLDHRDLLGDTLQAIAAEKAGILKPGVPVAVGLQEAAALDVLLARAASLGAPVLLRGRDWEVDGLPTPALPGSHQLDNAGIAVAALRAAFPRLPEPAIRAGLLSAEWPARLERLRGRLTTQMPPGFELWLDGGHNPGAGRALAAHFASWSDRPVHLVVGLNQTKDSAGFLRPLLPHAASIWAVAEPGQHAALPVEAIVLASGGLARPGPTVAAALERIGTGEQPGRVLVCGSLYLAGEVLKQDGPVQRAGCEPVEPRL